MTTRAAILLPVKRLLTKQEAAAYCGVSVNTLIAHVRISPVNIGNCVRYDIRDLDRWIDARANSAPVETMTGDEWLDRLDEVSVARA